MSNIYNTTADSRDNQPGFVCVCFPVMKGRRLEYIDRYFLLCIFYCKLSETATMRSHLHNICIDLYMSQ